MPAITHYPITFEDFAHILDHTAHDYGQDTIQLLSHVSQPKKQQSFQPAVDLYDGATSLILEVALPGVDKSAIGIDYDAKTNQLSISGETKLVDQKLVLLRERPYGRFERRINLRDQVINPENISAEYTDGILRVTLPKKELEARKKIQVQ